MTVTDKKGELNIRGLAEFYRAELLEQCVPFWEKHSPDTEFGGYITHLKRDGAPFGTGKLVWAQGREAYMFAKLYNTVEQREEWLAAAESGVDFISRYAFDGSNRAYYKLTRSGEPVYGRGNQIFAECFCLMAMAEYGKASGKESFINRAGEIFENVLRRVENNELHGESGFEQRVYREHATPMILINTAQELRSIIPGEEQVLNPLIKKWVEDELFLYTKDNYKALFERIDANGNVVILEPEGRQITPGHAMESAWFCLREGLYRQDDRIIHRACQVMKWSMELGWDPVFGGMYNYIDILETAAGHHDEEWGEDQDWDEKIFWIHAEALYALLLGYITTGDKELLSWYKKAHYWTFKYFPDREYGEWFGYLRRNGTVSQTIKGAMKGFFHIPRALLNCMLLLESKL